MQFSIIAMLGLGALAAAAPTLETRTGPTKCCPKGKTSGCSPCPKDKPCPKGDDTYSDCSFDQQIGLIDLFVCNVLNGNSVSIPISVSVL